MEKFVELLIERLEELQAENGLNKATEGRVLCNSRNEAVKPHNTGEKLPLPAARVLP